jgi:arylsulfatase A-like enzyme
MIAMKLLLIFALAALLPLISDHKSGAADRPNVILIVTDDQGYGDLGVHGNPKIRTPVLDAFAKESIELTHFRVCPVCSPTRSSLLTGRYNYRTGIIDTYLGRSLMFPDEVTLAEILKAAGYRTGIFGKWHLGDNYPMRPQDHGFEETLVCKGGGIGQPADPPGNRYFDPILFHNGKSEKCSGYCSDIFTDATLKFINQNGDKPFFVYLAYNAPHDPLQVADDLVAPYLKMDLSPKEFPQTGFPLRNYAPKEQIARVYAMVENIDTNVGRLLRKLDDKKLADNTIVIFLSDNGPAAARFNSGLRGRKGTVYEGGLRVPFFIRWPGHFAPGKLDLATAHIDVTPTLVEACGAKLPPDRAIDGRSLLPWLKGEKVLWKERTLFFQWHRGDTPEVNRAFAAIGPRYKLLHAQATGSGRNDESGLVALFDLKKDPFEQTNLLESNRDEYLDLFTSLGKEYHAWFDQMAKTRRFRPPRIYIGDEHENPVTLTRQDWRGPRAGWGIDDLGYWEVHVARDGKYNIKMRFGPRPEKWEAVLRVGWIEKKLPVPEKATETVFTDVELTKGNARLETWLQFGNQAVGVQFVEVERK